MPCMKAALMLLMMPALRLSCQEPAFSTATAVKVSTESVLLTPADYKPVRGVHLSAWAAGAPLARRRFLEEMSDTVLNAVVVPVKEIEGWVYIPGVESARRLGTVQIAIPDPESMLRDFKAKGLHSIARVVLFKDDLLPSKRPEWAVRTPDGGVWRNTKGVAWVDPYRREIWEYNLDVASRAAALGFDEIQFDYVRFPSDGDTTTCRFIRADHSKKTAVENLAAFLRYARERLSPMGVPFSVAVFGMTTTAKDDMGIGQQIADMAEIPDFISPMMYPSHYARGEYGLANPNREPYKVIHRGLRDAKARLRGNAYKLRPYLQDFSLGHRYGQPEVRAQVLAARREGIESWILWNPSNRYTWKAIEVRNDSPLMLR